MIKAIFGIPESYQGPGGPILSLRGPEFWRRVKNLNFPSFLPKLLVTLERDSPLYKLFGAGWVQKGVGGIFLKIRPHSCV